MKLAELQAMNLEALQRLARSRGIPGAATLERSALIAALATLPEGADETAPAGAAEALRWEEAEVTELEGEPRHRRRVVPGSALPSRPGDYDSEIMARMYMEQGLPERAVEIYRGLLIATPDDPELAELLAEAEQAAEAAAKAEAQKARRRPSAPPHPPPAPHEPFGMLDFEELPDSYGVDEVEVLFKDPFSVFAYWEITEGGMNAAQARLGDEAHQSQLVLRVFSSTGHKGELGHTRDYHITAWRGRRYFPTPRAGVRLRAATGLVSPSGLFALIANSSVVRVPPAESAPYDPGAVDWMEVKPPRSRGEVRESLEIRRRAQPPGGVPPRSLDAGYDLRWDEVLARREGGGAAGEAEGRGEAQGMVPAAAPPLPGAPTSPGGPGWPGGPGGPGGPSSPGVSSWGRPTSPGARSSRPTSPWSRPPAADAQGTAEEETKDQGPEGKGPGGSGSGTPDR
jgi:hypothetical protein